MRTNGDNKLHKVQMALTLLLFILGVLLIVLSLGADAVGLDLTPGFGIAQMFQLLVGITCLTLAVFLYVRSLRTEGATQSLQADIGVRLAATGLVFAYVVGLADLIGIGTHVNPRFERPFVGPFQFGGLLLAVGMIIVGLALYHTSRGAGRAKSSMEFLVNGNGDHH
ncbi:MAG: hypothetical protein HND44_22215 [Chloroflexi bacterium]|nr:hypothetical protein [Ardenticatenaceae bacterium]MBL1131158.1 hypothetical protein [Chloroflexota bacterium]NOG37257.1 hypothetical protein [Chloroflexota bacterium]